MVGLGKYFSRGNCVTDIELPSGSMSTMVAHPDMVVNICMS